MRRRRTTWRAIPLASSKSVRPRPRAALRGERGAPAAASGKAVTERRAAVADLGLLRITATPAWGMKADEQVRVRSTLMSIVTVPIFNPEDIDGPLLGSLQVDSDLTVEEAGFTK